MKATRLVQTGEADPTNTTSAYYRGLAVRALAAAPKTLQKLVEDGYVGEAVGELGTVWERGKLRLHLFAPQDPSLLLTYIAGAARDYRYILLDHGSKSWYFNAPDAAREFRRIVDARSK